MSLKTRSSKYLVRNSHSYCFRMKVPLDLYSTIGKKELRYSLRTGYIGEAKQKAMLLAGVMKVLFKQLRQRGSRMKELSTEKIQEIVKEYITNSIDAFDFPPYPNEDFSLFDEASLPHYIEELGCVI